MLVLLGTVRVIVSAVKRAEQETVSLLRLIQGRQQSLGGIVTQATCGTSTNTGFIGARASSALGFLSAQDARGPMIMMIRTRDEGLGDDRRRRILR